MTFKGPFSIVLFSMFFIAATAVPCQAAQFLDPSASASSIPESELIQPAALVKLLQSHEAEKPIVLQVGSRVMFGQAHIPGSVYAGPGSLPDGLRLLKSEVASASKNKLIVIYCGCCPWTKCPNIAPAYKRLRELGFTNVKAVYFANNFGDDWLAKGFPIAQGQ